MTTCLRSCEYERGEACIKRLGCIATKIRNVCVSGNRYVNPLHLAKTLR